MRLPHWPSLASHSRWVCQILSCTCNTPSLLTPATMQVVPFPQMELVARWIARVLSGRSQLPTMMAMRQDSQSLYEHLRMQGMPIRWAPLAQHLLTHVSAETANHLPCQLSCLLRHTAQAEASSEALRFPSQRSCLQS